MRTPGPAVPGPAATTPPTWRPRAGDRRWSWLLFAVPAVVAAVLVGVLFSGGSRPAAQPHLAAFSLPRVTSGGAATSDPVRYPLSGALAGRPVILVFYASWCVDCRVDLPVAARVAAAESRAGNRAVFIGIDGNDTPASGWAFAKKRGVTFPVADDQQEQVARQIGVTGLPSTAVVNANGVVVKRFTGIISAAQLEAAVAGVAPTHAVHPGS